MFSFIVQICPIWLIETPIFKQEPTWLPLHDGCIKFVVCYLRIFMYVPTGQDLGRPMRISMITPMARTLFVSKCVMLMKPVVTISHIDFRWPAKQPTTKDDEGYYNSNKQKDQHVSNFLDWARCILFIHLHYRYSCCNGEVYPVVTVVTYIYLARIRQRTYVFLSSTFG